MSFLETGPAMWASVRVDAHLPSAIPARSQIAHWSRRQLCCFSFVQIKNCLFATVRAGNFLAKNMRRVTATLLKFGSIKFNLLAAPLALAFCNHKLPFFNFAERNSAVARLGWKFIQSPSPPIVHPKMNSGKETVAHAEFGMGVRISAKNPDRMNRIYRIQSGGESS